MPPPRREYLNEVEDADVGGVESLLTTMLVGHDQAHLASPGSTSAPVLPFARPARCAIRRRTQRYRP